MRHQDTNRLKQGWRVCVSLLVLALVLAVPKAVDAHAFLERSEPGANELLPAPPAEARLWFTEPLEVAYSQAALYDALGNRIETGPSSVGPDPNLLVLPLPETLANGTYTIAWRNISSADGHPAEGFVPFTIGTQADVQTPTPPDITDFDEPPTLIAALGRWLSLLGMISVLGSVVVWWWAIRPGITVLDATARRTVERHVAWLALAGALVALAGSLLMLAVQMATVDAGFSPTGVFDLLTDSRFGQLWLWRVALLLALLAMTAAWLMRGRLPAGLNVAIIGCAFVALVPYALNSHAAAITVGQRAAVVSQLVHLAAASLWVGGLFALVAGLFLELRKLPASSRQAVLALVIPRFSTLAIGSVIILALTGFYAAWLQVGSISALRETGYGQLLTVKVALFILLLLLGAINFFLLEPRLRTETQSGQYLARTVAGEAALGISVLFVVGILASLPTARLSIEEDGERSINHLFQDGVHATLYVSPGAVGANHYTVDFDLSADELPEGTDVILRASNEGTISGEREIILLPIGAARFEAAGSELSIAGQWNLELILRRPEHRDWRVATPLLIQANAQPASTPAEAPRFGGIGGATWLVASTLAIAGLIVALRHSRRVLAVGFAIILTVASIVGLATTIESATTTPAEINPIPVNEASLAAGERLFMNNCAACHGEDGRGVTVLLSEYPGVDLVNGHASDHDKDEIHLYIHDGIDGTPMPAFGGVLTEDEIWQLVIYIQEIAYSPSE